MKKVFRFFAIAALAFGMTNLVACGGDDEEGDGNGNNNQQQEEQGEPVLLDENFDSGIPSTWENIDADGDGYGWMISADLFGTPSGYQNTECAISASYINSVGALSPDNYLVSPMIHIAGAGGYNLTWRVCAQDAAYPADFYAVYVGKMENGSFVPTGNAIYEETIAAKGEPKDQGTWRQRSVNLDAFKGQDVQIAFRHFNCSDQFIMLLDDVKVSNE